MCTKVLRVKATGVVVESTLEIIYATSAFINPRKTRGPGKFKITHHDTDVNWNSQKTVTKDGQRVFVTVDGDEVRESELELVEEGAPWPTA